MDKMTVIESVRNYLDKEDWHYDYNAEKQFIKTGLNIHNKVNGVDIFFLPKEKGCVVVAGPQTSIKGDIKNADAMLEMYKLLNRINYVMNQGDFELDPRDGEIRIRTYLQGYALDEIPLDHIDSAISAIHSGWTTFGDAIATIAFGFSDHETEFKKAMDSLDD